MLSIIFLIETIKYYPNYPTALLESDMISVVNANALHIPLADGCVQTVVTSPPYWSLRDYGTPGQLGLESTPEEYVASMATVFREVWRVCRDDATVWLNLGDSYATGTTAERQEGTLNLGGGTNLARQIRRNGTPHGLKPKDLVGIPWRVAFALQADGWYLRSDIIWSKPNPMPESVTDRPTKAHEYLFLLSKQARYYFDQEAVRERAIAEEFRGGSEKHADGEGVILGRDTDPHGGLRDWRPSRKNDGQDTGGNGSKIKDHVGNSLTRSDNTRNLRTVWTIATQPYSGSHFATFPEKLVEPCVKAGTSERGCCPKCGKGWARMVEKEKIGDNIGIRGNHRVNSGLALPPNEAGNNHGVTTGWQPGCDCGTDRHPDGSPPYDPVPCLVLDPFAGTATVGRVCARLGRSFIGTELKFDYINLAQERTSKVQVEMQL